MLAHTWTWVVRVRPQLPGSQNARLRLPNACSARTGSWCRTGFCRAGLMSLILGLSACDSSSVLDDESHSPLAQNPLAIADDTPAPPTDNVPVGSNTNPGTTGSPVPEPALTDTPISPEAAAFPPHPTDLVEKRSSYQEDGYGTVDVIRMDVRTETIKGVCVQGDQSGCTLADVIADTNRKDDFTVKIPVHMSADDFAEDGLAVNAEMAQRGGTTRLGAQKSFKLRLEDKNALWRHERSMLLNKHPFENTRIRNKLAFDLMSEIPHLMSFRTQFVNLWIDDGQGPMDYGLFTHIEAPGANYLRKRDLDSDDRLYKVNFFRFADDDLRNTQVDAEGKPLDNDRFEKSLEIEAGKDHRPLVEMLTAFHDPSRSFDSILDEYFNRNNVLTWMAVNILLHQTDAVTHNYALYNPKGTKRFYFVPWDYDGGFVEESEPPEDFSPLSLQRRLYYSYARGINSDFITRYYRQPGAHERMLAAAQVLYDNYLTDANVSEKANRYADVVEPYLTRMPDSTHNPGYSEYAVGAFPRHVSGNLEALKYRFGYPMPPQLLEPKLIGTQWVFSWKPAYDLTGHRITYDLEIATSVDFAPDDIVLSVEDIKDAQTLVQYNLSQDRLRAGTHYLRIVARPDSDPDRYWQVAENDELNINGVTYFGVVQFIVP